MEILAWACCSQLSAAAIIVFWEVPLAVIIIYG